MRKMLKRKVASQLRMLHSVFGINLQRSKVDNLIMWIGLSTMRPLKAMHLTFVKVNSL